MRFEEYKRLYNMLRTPKDIEELAKQGLQHELLLVIYNQKVVRESTRRFYEVKNRSRKLLHQWKSGRSFIKIASDWNFPPVLIAHMILKEDQMPRKKFWKYLSNPEEIKYKRLKEELGRVANEDIVYSPQAMEKNFERGRQGEARLHKWLEERNIPFRTECDLKGKFPKTPDFLLGKVMDYNGFKVHWIESKASFGSPEEIRRNVRTQLKPYTELFGTGVVLYWFGYIEDLDMKIPEGIILADKGFLKHMDRNA